VVKNEVDGGPVGPGRASEKPFSWFSSGSTRTDACGHRSTGRDEIRAAPWSARIFRGALLQALRRRFFVFYFLRG